jgi:hypothetical protein
VPKVKKQKVHLVAPFHPYARAKKPLTFGHEAFASKSVDAGTGLKYHEFSNISFPAATHADPVASRNAYVQDTGLTPLQTVQSWGTPTATATGSALDPPQMYRSRRGSIVGLAPMPDGSVQGWRLHSLPTSEALRNQTATDSTTFHAIFDERASKLTKSAVNSKGKEQSVNAVLSDIGKVRFESTTSKFEFVDATHAMGVSGKGLDNRTSSKPQLLYAPSIDVAKSDGKSGSAAQTYHSEPMAVTLHNSSRTTTLEKDSGLVGIVASFPNQVCFQCGRMFQEKVGKDSVITGTPGRPFGGQKEGDMFSAQRGTTISRATPMSELVGTPSNRNEVKKLYDYHHR